MPNAECAEYSTLGPACKNQDRGTGCAFGASVIPFGFKIMSLLSDRGPEFSMGAQLGKWLGSHIADLCPAPAV